LSVFFIYILRRIGLPPVQISVPPGIFEKSRETFVKTPGGLEFEPNSICTCQVLTQIIFTIMQFLPSVT